MLDHLGELLLATIALNVIAMGLGFAAARLVRLERPQAVAISIELGIHNAALAVASIGTAVDERLAVPAAVYSAVMVVTGTAFAYAMARSGARQKRRRLIRRRLLTIAGRLSSTFATSECSQTCSGEPSASQRVERAVPASNPLSPGRT